MPKAPKVKAPKVKVDTTTNDTIPNAIPAVLIPEVIISDPTPKVSSTKVSSTKVSSPKAPTKRSAKSKAVPIVAVISSEGTIQGTFTPEPRRPLIAHFPFRSTEVQFQDGPLVYDPRPPGVPQPYDAFADDLYMSNSELLPLVDEQKINLENFPAAISESVTKEITTAPVVESEPPLKAFRTMDVMIEYHESNQTQTLPQSTSAACFWCAGGFEGRPVVLPTQEEGGVYTVYGNFCTLSCSLSYLLNEHVDPQVRWERQALLHRMYSQIESIHPAPPRESLKFFGGVLSHQQYRDVIEKKKLRIDAHLPPVISILATLDTKPIDFYETSLRNTTATGAGLDIVKPMESGLRLKRSKPLKDKESTLDAVMNLHVKSRV